MARSLEEWMRQADYDLATAKVMFDARRYFYAVFMCHLSLEKALKGLYQAKLKQVPPKIHSLVFFTEKLSLPVTKRTGDFLFMLNRYGVTTRYPEEIAKLIREFPKARTCKILAGSRETLQWLKEELRK